MTSNAPGSTVQDETAIHQLVADANAYQSDPERLMALHTEDVVIVNLAGIRVLGRRAYREAMTRALGTRLSHVITRSEVADIRFVRPDVAVVSCLKDVEDQNPDASQAKLPLSGRLTYVMVDQGDGWRIAMAQTTPIISG